MTQDATNLTELTTTDFASNNPTSHFDEKNASSFSKVVPTTRLVSAPCGSSKTTELCNLIKENSQGMIPSNFVIACPTKILIKQYIKQFAGMGLVDVIHPFYSSEDQTKSVVQRVKDFCTLEADYIGGFIILITHDSFVPLSRFFKTSGWNVFVDEIPEIAESRCEEIPYSRHWLKEIITGSRYNAKLVELKIKDRKDFAQREASKDGQNEGFKHLFEALKSEYHRIFTTTDAYDILKGNVSVKKCKEHRLPYVSLVEPEVYANTTVMGANIELSMFYDHLERHDHKFAPHNKIVDRLRYTTYPANIFDRLELFFLLPERFSQQQAKSLLPNGRLLKEEMDKIVLEAFKGKKFLCHLNKRDKGLLFQASNSTTLPYKPSGLNDYRKFNNFVSTAAYNRNNTDLSILKNLGFTQDSIIHTTQTETIHQAVMRSKLRVEDSVEKVKVIVADAYVADGLVTIFGCAKPSKLGDLVANSKPKELSKDKLPILTPSQRKQRSKANKFFDNLGLNRPDKDRAGSDDVLREQIYLNVKDENSTHKTTNEISHYAEELSCTGEKIPETAKQIREADSSKSDDDFTIALTFHNDLKDSADRHSRQAFTLRELVAKFAFLSDVPRRYKEEARYFNPCTFVNSGSLYRFKTTENFVSASAIVLDFDEGDMSPQMFEKMFWLEADKLDKMSFMICNSFSHRIGGPYHFHVIVPLREPITSVDDYTRYVDYFRARLDALLPAEIKSGLDPHSRNAVHTYLLPCKNSHYPEDAFFGAYGLNKKYFKTYAFPNKGFQKNWAVKQKQLVNLEVQTYGGKDPEKLNALRLEIEAFKLLTDGRNDPYWRLTKTMKWAGLEWHEAKAELRKLAKGEAKMLKRVRENLKTVYGVGR